MWHGVARGEKTAPEQVKGEWFKAVWEGLISVECMGLCAFYVHACRSLKKRTKNCPMTWDLSIFV